jgi:hypothetical protein
MAVGLNGLLKYSGRQECLPQLGHFSRRAVAAVNESGLDQG